MKLFNLATIILILALFAVPAFAQDDSVPSEVSMIIPPLLLGLIAANNRATEGFKLYLASPQLPFTPAAELKSFLTLLFSVGFGIASAWLTPNATDWLGADFTPLAAVVVTGVSVSLGGASIQLVLSLLQSLKRQEATPKG